MSHVFNSESCLFKLSVASTPWRMSLQWVMSLMMSHVSYSESCLFKLSVASTPWHMSLQWVMSLIMSHVSYSESCLFKLSIASTSWRMSLQWVMSRERHWPAAVELNKVALIHSHTCHHLWDVGVRIYTILCVCVCVCVCLCEYVWMSGSWWLCVCL